MTILFTITTVALVNTALQSHHTIQWPSTAISPLHIYYDPYQCNVCHQSDIVRIVGYSSFNRSHDVCEDSISDAILTVNKSSSAVQFHGAADARQLLSLSSDLTRSNTFSVYKCYNEKNDCSNIHTVIPLIADMVLDARVFTNFEMLHSQHFASNGLISNRICAAIEHTLNLYMTKKTSILITFSMPLSKGNISSVFYWMDRCGLSSLDYLPLSSGTEYGVYIAHIWSVTSNVLARAATADHQYPSALNTSSPCILHQAIRVPQMNDHCNVSIKSRLDNMICLEELLEWVSGESVDSELVYISSTGISDIVGITSAAPAIPTTWGELLFVMTTYQGQATFLEQEYGILKLVVKWIGGDDMLTLGSHDDGGNDIQYLKKLIRHHLFNISTKSPQDSDSKLHELQTVFKSVIPKNTEHHIDLHISSHWGVFIRDIISDVFSVMEVSSSGRVNLSCDSNPFKDLLICQYTKVRCTLATMLIDLAREAGLHLPRGNSKLLGMTLDFLGHVLHTDVSTNFTCANMYDIYYNRSDISSQAHAFIQHQFRPCVQHNRTTHIQQPVGHSMEAQTYSTQVVAGVLEKDLLEAQKIVHLWRTHIGSSLHVHIDIVPLPSSETGIFMAHDSAISSFGNIPLSKLPSIRSFLLTLDQWISRQSTSHSIVVCFLGIEAMRSAQLPQEGSLVFGPFMTAQQYYNDTRRHLAPLTFASRVCDPFCSSAVDLRSFIGYAYEIKTMLYRVLSHPLYGVSEVGIVSSLLSYIDISRSQLYCLPSDFPCPTVIAIDTTLNVFDMRKSSSQNLYQLPSRNRQYTTSSTSCYQYFNVMNQTQFSSLELTEATVDCLRELSLSGNLNALFSTHVYVLGLLGFQGDIFFNSFYSATVRRLSLTDGITPLDEKLTALETLEKLHWIYSQYILADAYFNDPEHRPRARYTQPYLIYHVTSEIYHNLGLYRESVTWLLDSLEPPLYSTVQAYRKTWDEQKRNLNVLHDIRSDGTVQTRHKVWLLTCATYIDDRVMALKMSAMIAGVNLSVVGVGRPYSSTTDRMEYYLEELRNNKLMDDSDVVVIFDAYDVLLMPAIRHIGKRLEESPTPIIHCAENNAYPTQTVGWANFRTTSTNVNKSTYYQSDMYPKYLNGGCVVGRVQQMRELYEYTFRESNSMIKMVEDDQQLFSLFAAQNPHIMSIDYTNDIFLCTLGLRSSDFDGLSGVFAIQTANKVWESELRCVSLVHGNGAGGKHIYARFVDEMKRIVATKYSAKDDVQSLYDYWDNHSGCQ